MVVDGKVGAAGGKPDDGERGGGSGQRVECVPDGPCYRVQRNGFRGVLVQHAIGDVTKQRRLVDKGLVAVFLRTHVVSTFLSSIFAAPVVSGKVASPTDTYRIMTGEIQSRGCCMLPTP